jgi:outer membrane murein-binding lipoprotein Lpp
MLTRLSVFAIIAFGLIFINGCEKSNEPAASDDQPKITKENLNSEIDKLEQEIEADMTIQE